VSRYLLDTNIISNVTRPAPSDRLVAWMAEQADEDLFISSLTVAEIRRGILEKPAGKKRELYAEPTQSELFLAAPSHPATGSTCLASSLCLHSRLGHCHTEPDFSHFSIKYGLPHSGHFSGTGLPHATKLQSGQRLQP